MKDAFLLVYRNIRERKTRSILTMLGIVVARPLGPALQAHVTTQADVGDLRIVSVTREDKGGLVVHHVRTAG